MPGMRMIVFSRTLRQQDFPDITIIAEKLAETIAGLRSKPGKDIWLFGGGSLFRCLLEAPACGHRRGRRDPRPSGSGDSTAATSGQARHTAAGRQQGVHDRDRVAGVRHRVRARRMRRPGGAETIESRTPYGRCEYTPPDPPFVRGGKETARSASFSPPYEGGVRGGSSFEDIACMQANREPL